MHKKLVTFCMALVAFILFVATSSASASPVLTENGSTVAVGSSITWKTPGNVKFTTALTYECPSADWVGYVTENLGTRMAGEIPIGNATIGGTGASGDCTTELGGVIFRFTSKLCWESTREDRLVMNGCGANITLNLEITGAVPCKYAATSMSSTYNTNVTPAVLTFSEQEIKKTEGSTFCPGSVRFDMAFDLYTTGGTTGLTIS